MSRRQHGQPLTLGGQERATANEHCAYARLDHCCEGSIQFACSSSFYDLELASPGLWRLPPRLVTPLRLPEGLGLAKHR